MAPSEYRDEEGKFKAGHGVSKEDLYDAMKPGEPYTTGELADMIDAPRRTVFNYLDQMADEGLIRKKKPEPRRAIWIRN